jgi:tyrosine phenol-lyase
MTTRAEREQKLRDAGYNLFLLDARDVLIDLLTDSGTAAMSDASGRDHARRRVVRRGAQLPPLPGDGARASPASAHHPHPPGPRGERILFSLLAGPGTSCPQHHFDTTRANIEVQGAEAVDLVIPEGRDPASLHPFKGNIDLAALERLIDERGAERIPLCLLTVTNNSGGGQPVSLENIRAAKELCRATASRSSWTPAASPRTPGSSAARARPRRPVLPLEIAREMFSLPTAAP